MLCDQWGHRFWKHPGATGLFLQEKLAKDSVQRIHCIPRKVVTFKPLKTSRFEYQSKPNLKSKHPPKSNQSRTMPHTYFLFFAHAQDDYRKIEIIISQPFSLI